MKNKVTLLFISLLFVVSSAYTQISIINANINEYNITPSSLSQISINNSGQSGIGRVEIILTNSANITLLTASSSEIEIKSGINIFGAHNLSFITFQYGLTPQAKYLKNQHRLSSGAFNYCIRIVPVTGIEEGDEYCQSINTSENEQLYLINPIDEEEIETTTPILMWMHTEAFNLLGEGEFFRMTLVEVNKDQDPNEAMVNNVPIFIKSYVSKHQVQYPFDAKKLENGMTYAWQVQKIANGNILASTETWSFSLDKPELTENTPVALKKKLDGSIYIVQDSKLYFRFDERYNSTTSNCKIYNEKREEIVAEANNQKEAQVGAKDIGYNSYELDLNFYGLKKGYYTLEVLNEKKEKYQLKFYVE